MTGALRFWASEKLMMGGLPSKDLKWWSWEEGANRDAVDRGWARYPQQVGLSGKTISPVSIWR